MLFYGLPLAAFLVIGFLSISWWNRGEIGMAFGLGVFALAVGFGVSAITCLIVTDWDKVHIQDSGPVDGDVDVDPITGTVTFETNGERKFFERPTNDSSLIVIPSSDKGVYKKICGDTPDWAANFNFASCRTEIYAK